MKKLVGRFVVWGIGVVWIDIAGGGYEGKAAEG